MVTSRIPVRAVRLPAVPVFTQAWSKSQLSVATGIDMIRCLFGGCALALGASLSLAAPSALAFDPTEMSNPAAVPAPKKESHSAATPATAPDSDPSDHTASENAAVTEMEQVVVTATRNDVATFDAPAAVSVVTAKDIETKSAVRVIDALKDLPGVYIRDNDGAPSAFAEQVLIRGIAGYNRNAVLLDGQPLNDAFSNGVNWSQIDNETVQRVEVVRGPFSSLYGGAAMGGVVNIITKSPIKDEYIFKGGYGSDDLSSGYAAISHRFGDHVGVRVEVGTKSSGGFVENLVTESPHSGSGEAVNGAQETTTPYGANAYLVGNKGQLGWWQNNAAITTRIDTSSKSQLDLAVRYHDDETFSSNPQTFLTDAATGALVSSGNVAVNSTQYVSVKPSDYLGGPTGERSWRYSLAFKQRVGDSITAKVDAYYDDIDYFYITPTSGVATPNGGGGLYVDIPNDRGGLNATLGFPIGSVQDWIVGVGVTGDDLDKRQRNIEDWRSRGTPTTSDVTYRARGNSETYAGYFQDTITATSQLTFYAGLRYDLWSTAGEVQQFIAPAFDANSERHKAGALSPKLSAVYKPFEDTVIRASAGGAFRSPTLSDLYSTFTSSNGSTTYASPSLKPEKIRSVELGGEQRLWGGQISATLFYNQLRDLLSSMSVPNSANPSINDSVRVNVGRATSEGFEIEAKKKVVAGVEVFANFTYTDTDVKKNIADPLSVGKHLTLIPEETASFGAQIQEGPVTAYAAGRYVGKVYSDSHNLDALSGVYGSYDPYFVIDAKVGYRPVNWCTLSLSGFNLLDRTYFQSGYAAGRTVLGELALHF